MALSRRRNRIAPVSLSVLVSTAHDDQQPLLKYVREHGVSPEELRNKAWPVLLTAGTRASEPRTGGPDATSEWGELVALSLNAEAAEAWFQTHGASEPWDHTVRRIRMDAERVSPEVPLFSGNARAAGIERLVRVLTAYALYNPPVGYCQGMTDLLAPFLQLYPQDAEAFRVYCLLMRRVYGNFLTGMESMQRQLRELARVVHRVAPRVHRHLVKIGAGTYVFAFQMLLLQLRREVAWSDVFALWECMWACEGLLKLQEQARQQAPGSHKPSSRQPLRAVQPPAKAQVQAPNAPVHKPAPPQAHAPPSPAPIAPRAAAAAAGTASGDGAEQGAPEPEGAAAAAQTVDAERDGEAVPPCRADTAGGEAGRVTGVVGAQEGLPAVAAETGGQPLEGQPSGSAARGAAAAAAAAAAAGAAAGATAGAAATEPPAASTAAAVQAGEGANAAVGCTARSEGSARGGPPAAAAATAGEGPQLGAGHGADPRPVGRTSALRPDSRGSTPDAGSATVPAPSAPGGTLAAGAPAAAPAGAPAGAPAATAPATAVPATGAATTAPAAAAVAAAAFAAPPRDEGPDLRVYCVAAALLEQREALLACRSMEEVVQFVNRFPPPRDVRALVHTAEQLYATCKRRGASLGAFDCLQGCAQPED